MPEESNEQAEEAVEALWIKLVELNRRMGS
jgi:hypothetical protein